MVGKLIKYTPHFNKNFKKRISNNNKLLQEFLDVKFILKINPNDPSLRRHKLRYPMLNLESISLNLDYRIIFFETEEAYILVDIGSHDQVYR